MPIISPWIYLAVAVAANVATNAIIKVFAESIDPGSIGAMAWQAAKSPWLWIGMATGGLMSVSYTVAVRSLDLSIAYAVMTAASIVAIGVVAIFVFDEAMTTTKAAGLLFLAIGIGLMAKA